MLSAKRRLCTSCREDLLAVFLRGFCGPDAALRLPSQTTRSLARWQRQTRAFHATGGFTERRKPGLRPSIPRPKKPAEPPREPLLSDEELTSQFEALDALEPYANEPEPPQRHASRSDPEAPDNVDSETPTQQSITSNTIVQDDALEDLRDLRDSGADAAEVAAQARQTFGDRLPMDALHGDELKIYTRLFGDPLLPEEVPDPEETALFDQQGEEIEHDFDQHRRGVSGDENEALLDRQDHDDQSKMTPISQAGAVNAQEQEEMREEEEEDGEEDAEEDPSFIRQHPITTLGKFETRPKTISLPRDEYLKPFDNIMLNYNNTHLKEVCAKAFGGPGLADSPLTPRSGKGREQVAVQLDASQHFMGEMEANAFVTAVMPPAYAAITATLVDARKRLGSTWLNNLLAKEGGPRILDAGAGGAGILAWNEITKAHWESLHTSEKNPNPVPQSKAVVLAGSNPLRHRGAAFLENTTFVPRLPDYVTTRSKPTIDDDRPSQHRREFDVILSSYSLLPFREEWERKHYVQNLWSLLSPKGGVLIMIEKGMPRGFEAIAGARELLLERAIATPPGQDTKYTKIHKQAEADGAPWTPEPGMIVGPCTNHEPCPMYKIPGISVGRKDICAFDQRYIRPPYLQRVLGADKRNHDDVDFSYVSVMKGRDLRQSNFSAWDHFADPLSAPLQASEASSTPTDIDHANDSTDLILVNNLTAPSDLISDENTTPNTAAYPPTHLLPRLVFPPIKRRGHVILDLCTPTGAIERWTVPRSWGKQPYRDARKAQQGDIWGLDAKTKRPRTLRHGSGSRDKVAAILGGHLKGRGREERLRNLAMRTREREAQAREEEREERIMEERLDEVDAARYRNDKDGFGARATRRLGKAKPAGSSRGRAQIEDDDEDADMNPEQMDALDYEIEMKLRAWEAELSDKRPLDKYGRPERAPRRRKAVVSEPEKEVLWKGMGNAAVIGEGNGEKQKGGEGSKWRWAG